MFKNIALISVLALGCTSARAEVKPNGLFSDNMVLQQGTEVPVWGTARDGETVTVELAGQKATAIAQEGKWMVRLQNLAAGGPHTLTIRGDNVVTIQNVLVGEVWLCSGQSNMGRTLVPPESVQPRLSSWTEEAAAANYPQIRHFRVKNGSKDIPQSDVQGQWELCSPETAPDFTAVGFYFAKDMFNARNVPIGLINASVGATGATTWTGREALESNPELKKLFQLQERIAKEYPARLEQYKADEPKLLEKYNADLERAQKEKAPLPLKPAPPGDPARDPNRPSSLYNGKIAPLQPFAIKGVLWYQGENNAGNARQYQILFPALIAGWRQAWGRGDFPFLFVQLAPYQKTGPEIREAQRQTWLTTPNTAMVVTTDAADGTDIHPPDKRPVGSRLALAARGLAYGEKIEYSGPLLDTMTIEGNRAVLRFKHASSGLVAKDGDLRGFTIAGRDKKFLPAKAQIQGETIIVSSSEVPAPAFVRYGWTNVPDGNLYNHAGLPASPFQGQAS